MRPIDLCRLAYEAGLSLRADGDELIVSPAANLEHALRELLIEHKPDLLAFLADCRATTAEVVREALLTCDRYGDGPQARADMARDCEATPPHLLPDLLEHFQTQNRGTRHQ